MEITLEFNAALMREKARTVIAGCEQMTKICRRIQDAAEAGCFSVTVYIDKDRLPGKADIHDVVTFFRTMGFRVSVCDFDCSTILIMWGLNTEPLRDIDESLVEIIDSINDLDLRR